MSVTFFDVDFEGRETFGLGLEKHKLAYSVNSGRTTTTDCCIVTYSTISSEVKEGDILVKVNDVALINNPYAPPGHFETCIKALSAAKRSLASIRFLRCPDAAENLERQSDLTIVDLSTSDASMIYYEVKLKELDDKNRKREVEKKNAIEKESERIRAIEEKIEFDKNQAEIRALEEHAARVMAERARVLKEEQERLRFELVPSQANLFQQNFPGEESLGLDIVPRQVNCVMPSGVKLAMDCCVVTGSSVYSHILPGDIITKINGNSIAVISKTLGIVAADFLGTTLRIIGSAASPRVVEFMRPSGSTPECPAGFNPYLIIRLTANDEAYIFNHFVNPIEPSRPELVASSPTPLIPLYVPSVRDNSNQYLATEEEIERRVLARMRDMNIAANESIAKLDSSEGLTEEEDIARRVAIEAKKFLKEQMARMEADRLERLAAHIAAEQAELENQKLLVAEEIKRADEHTRKAIADAEEREAQSKQAAEEIRRLLEIEVRKRVDLEMKKVEEENARNLVELERQINETANILSQEEEKRIQAEIEAESIYRQEELEAQKIAEEQAVAAKIDDEVKKRVSQAAKRAAEEKRLDYLQHLEDLESKLVNEEMSKKAAEEQQKKKEQDDLNDFEEKMRVIIAEQKRSKQIENQAAFDYANSRSPATASVFSITFPNAGSLGLALAPHNITYTDINGRLQTIDCCMVIGSTLTDDVEAGDILMSVNNSSLIENRADTFETSTQEFFASVMSTVTHAEVPRTVRYFRLPAGRFAVGSLSMNTGLSDALLLLAE